VQPCTYVQAKETTSTGSTSLGLVQKGDSRCLQDTVTGGKYTACGSTSKAWYKIWQDGRDAYVAKACFRVR
jgi:hypothetical protein